jgi:hypothetical protein
MVAGVGSAVFASVGHKNNETMENGDGVVSASSISAMLLFFSAENRCRKTL